MSSFVSALQEREKELRCLYAIEEILEIENRPLEEVLQSSVDVLPPGWQYPDICQAEIEYNGSSFRTAGFSAAVDTLRASIVAEKKRVGEIRVAYTEKKAPADDGPFLNEEIKLINTIAKRLGYYILHQQMKGYKDSYSGVLSWPRSTGVPEWKVAIDLLCKTDRNLLERVSRKMINHLLWNGMDVARSLLERYGRDVRGDGYVDESNQPRQKSTEENLAALSEDTFAIAAKHMGNEEILGLVQKWIHEDKTSILVKPLLNVHASLTDITDAMQRYQHLKPKDVELNEAAANGIRVALIRRFLTEQLDFIKIAKDYVEPDDFFDLVERLIYPTGSHGKLGGKSAGLFLASCALSKRRAEANEIGEVRTPRTWYITSEGLHEFVYYNNLEEFYEQKYKSIKEIRQDYPHIVQIFKRSHFPKEIVKGLSMALDDFGEVPLIVRSSSLLEDRMGAAFSGKYRSLFLGNQGDKKTRLEALMDAITEVYASTFGPDPIEYRAERGLLDFNEQMAIMIQEVVGKKVGRYFFPAFSGVAFSNNEFRWSPRIKREDGLLRIVPGLGTRAVDRLIDDHPVLVAIRQPSLRINITMEEMVRYSPKKTDVINLESNRFETLNLEELMREFGEDYPAVSQVVSILKDGVAHRPLGLMTDFRRERATVTFDGLISGGEFVKQVGAIMDVLSEMLGAPVDIEFASDGEVFYLLQCRPQSYSKSEAPAEIPNNVAESDVVFTANRYVSNGNVSDITHIVYVEPARYGALSDLKDLHGIGRIVRRLNRVLPKKRFILIGPGRWGSRGDIKLGVRVTYSDINNTAMLIEVARKNGNYVPDLSFGTHFFQDLVEASVRYLPLYPDDDGILFNEDFLLGSTNSLVELLDKCDHLADVVRVIDIPAVTRGKVLSVLMNADQDRAMGLLVDGCA